MDSKKYAVSVVVPVFNGENAIRRTLDSLLDQTFESLQIVCVDDGSTDSTASILTEISASEPRLKVVATKNHGTYKAREAGIEVAEGEYIGFCDCGDTVEPSMFEELYECAKRNSADIVVCGYRRMRDEAVISEEMQQGEERVAVIDVHSGWLAAVNTSLWNKLIEAKVLQKRIRLSDSPRIMEDAMLLFSIYPYAKRMAFLPKELYRYNTVGGSAMSRVEPNELDGLFENWLDVRNYAMQHVPGFQSIIDIAAFVHMGISASLRLLQNRGSAAKQDILNICRHLEKDFSTLVGSQFLNSTYVKSNSSMKGIKLAYICWRLHLLIPTLKAYAVFLDKANKGISW